MPELISVELGLHVAGGKDDEESTVILKRSEEGEPSCVDLPKLTTLRTVDNSYSFYSPYCVTLKDMPSLTDVYLPYHFQYRNNQSKQSSLSPHFSLLDIGALANYT